MSTQRFSSHFAVGGVALAIGIFFVALSFMRPPGADSLTAFIGTVTAAEHVQSSKNEGYQRVVLDSLPRGQFLALRYDAPWDRPCAKPSVGSRVAVRATQSALDADRWYVWELAVGGTPCVRYEELMQAGETDEPITLVLGALLALGGLGFLLRGVMLRRR